MTERKFFLILDQHIKKLIERIVKKTNRLISKSKCNFEIDFDYDSKFIKNSIDEIYNDVIEHCSKKNKPTRVRRSPRKPSKTRRAKPSKPTRRAKTPKKRK
jgi:hypothetical protein